MTLEALIFDVDGTLADTERDGHRVAFNIAFAEHDLDWSWGEALYGELLSVTGGKERIRYYIDHFRRDYQKPENLDELVVQLHAAKTRHYTELLAEGSIPLRPGVLRLVKEAKQTGLRLAIATTTTPANVSALLQHAMAEDAENWFEVIGAGDVVAAKKPAPDIFHYVLEKMNLEAHQCMAFEDSYNGIQASMAAGLKTIVTVNKYTQDHDFTGAAIVLNEMGEPDRPFTVLSNTKINGTQFLDLALVRHLHSGD